MMHAGKTYQEIASETGVARTSGVPSRRYSDSLSGLRQALGQGPEGSVRATGGKQGRLS